MKYRIAKTFILRNVRSKLVYETQSAQTAIGDANSPTLTSLPQHFLYPNIQTEQPSSRERGPFNKCSYCC